MIEILHHAELAIKNCLNFGGPSDLADSALEILYSNNERPTNRYGISLLITGPSGSGKAELMSHLARRCYMMETEDESGLMRPVIMRFCGASGDSTTGIELLRSLCSQITALTTTLSEEVRSEKLNSLLHLGYDDLREEFLNHLRITPLFLFIIGLDNLSDDHLARSDISFLKGAHPHPNSRIIVSTESWNNVLPNRGPQSSNHYVASLNRESLWFSSNLNFQGYEKWKEIEHKLELNWMGDSADSEPTPERAEVMLSTLLARKNRQLTPAQMGCALQRILEEPSALYIRMLVILASKLTSADVTSGYFAPGLRGIIEQVFGCLEQEYGRELVAFSLGCIAFSAAGIRDSEMVDLISSDRVVRSFLTKHWMLDGNMLIPVHLWLRLKEAIEDLLALRKGGKVILNHRQLRDVARDRYRTRAEGVMSYHEVMARYFGDLPTAEMQVIAGRQPLTLNGVSVWLKPAIVNRRRCVEGAYHLIACGMLSEVIVELCHPETLCAFLREGLGSLLLQYLTDIVEAIKSSEVALLPALPRRRVQDYLRWLRRDVSQLSLDASYLLFLLSSKHLARDSIVREDLHNYWTERLEVVTLSWKDTSEVSSFMAARAFGTENHHVIDLDLQGHTSSVRSIAWSPDGRQLLSGGDDKTIKLWDVVRGQLVYTFGEHQDAISAVAWAPSGDSILSASRDSSIIRWDVHSRDVIEVYHIPIYQSPTCIIWSPRGDYFATAAGDLAFIFDLIGGAPVRVLRGHGSWVTSIAWSPDASRLLSGSEDKTVRTWDPLKTEDSLIVINTPFPVTAVVWSPNGNHVAAASYDSTIRIWNANSAKLVRTYALNSDVVWSISWSPHADKILAASADGKIRILSRGKVERVFIGHMNSVTAVAWCPDGNSLASCSEDGTVKVWHDSIISDVDQDFDKYPCPIHAVAFSPDGRQLLVGREDGVVKLWDIESGKSIMSKLHEDAVTSVAWSPDGNMIISGGRDHIIWSLHLQSFKFTTNLRFRGHNDIVTSLAWASDGTKFASSSIDCFIRIWNPESGKCERTLGLKRRFLPFSNSDMRPIVSVAWSPSGKYIADAAADGRVHLWDVETQLVVQVLHGHSRCLLGAIWSRDGSKVLSGCEDGRLIVWDVESGHVIRSFDQTGMTAFAWTADEKYVVVGSSVDHSIKLLDATDRSVLLTLRGHTSIVKSVACSVDMKYIASGGRDSTTIVHSLMKVKCAAN